MKSLMLNICECKSDGFCKRYQRDMGGRMREICAGTNVDLGTAAAFREQWAREAGTAVHLNPSTKPIPLLLKTGQAPGDAVAMTAAIYSLHKAHPEKYTTAVESYWPEVFEHNPNVVAHYLPTEPPTVVPGMSVIEMHYPAIHDSNRRGIHFMQGWCEFLGSALNITVPLLTNRPHLYFDTPDPPIDMYWLICSGGKKDFTNKLWGHDNYQEVVARLLGNVLFLQVGGAKPTIPWSNTTMGSQDDSHPILDGAINLVGTTSLRRLFDLVRSSRGVVCGVSLLMHVAAALGKPAVVIAGGREPVAWNAYPNQQYLHTVGALPCSSPQGDIGGACWRSRTVALGDGTGLDNDLCQRPVGNTPECMTLISPARVVDTILMYNKQHGKTS